MSGTIWHCMVAVSLDGKIARPDGSVEDWLSAYPAEDFGFDRFLKSVDAIVMGRKTYDLVRGFGEWPYASIPTVVVTSRELGPAPPGVEAMAGDIAAIAEAMEHRGHRRVWIEGGGQIVRALMAIGKLDVLEVGLIPVVLGDGVPLFPSPTVESWFRLVECETKAKGALRLVYERAPSS